MGDNPKQSKYLSLRRPPKNIFEVSNLRKEYKKLKEDVLTLNRIWRDVQKLNNFSHCLLGEIAEMDDSLFECVWGGLEVVTKDFYVHFSIVYKMLEKICKDDYSGRKKLNNFFTNFDKNIGKNVQILRNNLIIHTEKSDFKQPHGWVFDSSQGGLSMVIMTKENEEFNLNPLKDGKMIEENLFKLKEVIEVSKNKNE
ncbi:MAG: hypothetical protein ACOC5T_09165 [Elusimicrobiota bacterium]